MINITKAASKNTRPVVTNAIKQVEKTLEIGVSNSAESVNLNNIPHYKIVSPILTAREYLSKFFSEYKDIKSATFVCEEIKRAIKNGSPNSVIDELINKRQQYHKNIKIMRQNMWSKSFNGFNDYIQALSLYIKDNGTYMNCGETADLLSFLFAKSGIKSNKVFMHTVDNQGEPVSKAEHVFCVLGINKKSDISNISTVGNFAAICDPWANIALSVKDGIEYYKKLFSIDSTKHILKFDDCPYHYPGCHNKK